MMKQLYMTLVAAALMSGAVSGNAHGQEAQEAVKIDYPAFPASSHIHGPKITKEDLQGKVVFFEYWGINCGPCIASMPHLQDMQDKFESKGFTVIGSHSQGLDDSVKKFLKDKKITFPVYQQIRLKGAESKGGIPYAVLIGASGKVVAQGHPTDIYKLVRKEVDKAAKGYPILENVKLDKYKSLEKSVLSRGSNIESKIAPLRNKTDDEEAQLVCRTFDEWLANAKVAVQYKLSNDPLEAVPAIVELKTAVPSVTEFDAELAKLKANRDLSKLASLQKKIRDLEQKKIKRGRISDNDVKSVTKDLEQYVASTDPVTSSVAARLKLSVDELAAPPEK